MGYDVFKYTCQAHNLQLPHRFSCPKCAEEKRKKLHEQGVACAEHGRTWTSELQPIVKEIRLNLTYQSSVIPQVDAEKSRVKEPTEAQKTRAETFAHFITKGPVNAVIARYVEVFAMISQKPRDQLTLDSVKNALHVTVSYAMRRYNSYYAAEKKVGATVANLTLDILANECLKTLKSDEKPKPLTEAESFLKYLDGINGGPARNSLRRVEDVIDRQRGKFKTNLQEVYPYYSRWLDTAWRDYQYPNAGFYLGEATRKTVCSTLAQRYLDRIEKTP